MAAKSKKILLQNLNTLILDTILAIKEEGEDVGVAELRKQWESADFQKKMAVEVFGIKSKNLTPGPKRNKSAYMFFCQDMRQKIVADNPECKPHQIMSLLGSKWRELTTKQKSKYYEQAAEDKERYLDMKELEKRRNKTPSKLSSYFLFCEDERPLVKKEFPQMKTKKVTAECGKRWNELKINEPERYKYYVEKAAK
ncbi:High mobility group protein homolog [Invertebrate iridescent virus 30]|uniref:High mobility group protein homolog n=2 Tax=Invertebrate iridescent virus 22 TaxID=345198 RepID=W8W2W3_9VIRU|nr:High mobility group protein homolog [Invertebrate iridescent virus 30]YP_009010806.1 High mobility group protein homolog [Invertebrate iridescent virus 22]CCV01889.1 High mobility group protein homolog [Invertebrate iridescent virus 22]CCV02239.1 High mobility group protein homolog [Invertebrate iridescent virus 30]